MRRDHLGGEHAFDFVARADTRYCGKNLVDAPLGWRVTRPAVAGRIQQSRQH